MSSSQEPRALEPPRWDTARLETERIKSTELFRRTRMHQPLDRYLRLFDDAHQSFEALLSTSDDLRKLGAGANRILTDPTLLKALCYVAAPPISVDDLKLLTNTHSLSAAALTSEPGLVAKLIETVLDGLDPRRFPWVAENRPPTGEERRTAVTASASVLAANQVAAARGIEGRGWQEDEVEEALVSSGLRKSTARTATTIADAARPGEFSRESVFLDRKTDFLIGLWDNRLMPLECTISSSTPNSVKRLGQDLVAKASVWTRELGSANVVPAVVLSGVFDLRQLQGAQDRGLALFWTHSLGDLTDWIAKTRS